MGLFSGIMVNVEEKGYELSVEDVRIQFNEAFEVLNAEAASFESFCGAVEKLELLNKSIQENGGKADKSLVAFLNQNNGLADALGIDLSMEDFNDVVVGSEVSAACEGALSNIWEAIKNFFKNIWDGINNFWNSFKNMFRSTKANLEKVKNDPKFEEKLKAAAEKPAENANKKSSAQAKYIEPKVSNNNTTAVVRPEALKRKLIALENLFNQIDSFEKADSYEKFIACYKALNIKEAANEFKLTQKGLDWEFTGSMFGPEDIAAASPTVGGNMIVAGYTPDSVEDLVKVCVVLEGMERGAQVSKNALNQIIKMPPEKFPKEANVQEAKATAKLILLLAKLSGTIAGVLHGISKDLLDICSTNLDIRDMPQGQTGQNNQLPNQNQQ